MWQIRQMIALAVLAVCSYTDIKERNIYLIPVLVSSAGAQASLAISVIGTAKEEAFRLITVEMLLPLAIGSAVIALTRALKKHIGMGDGYLVAALGMITGIRTLFFLITVALFTAAAYGFIRIMLNKRRTVRTIPFAPFVLTGFMTVLINEI